MREAYALRFFFSRNGSLCCPLQPRGDCRHGRDSYQSAAMVTRIAVRKVSIESSDRAIKGGELGWIKKENEKMTNLVKSLEDLKVALEKEN